MKNNFAKVIVTGITGFLSSVLGVLYVPVLLLIASNVIDYITGLMAAPNRQEGKIKSYRSMKGICKKVTMWLLVVVGAIIDELLKYSSEMLGIALPFTFLAACVVAVWLVCNELISILENMIDIGISTPAFLMPLVKHIKSQTENLAGTDTEKEEKQ